MSALGKLLPFAIAHFPWCFHKSNYITDGAFQLIKPFFKHLHNHAVVHKHGPQPISDSLFKICKRYTIVPGKRFTSEYLIQQCTIENTDGLPDFDTGLAMDHVDTFFTITPGPTPELLLNTTFHYRYYRHGVCCSFEVVYPYFVLPS